MNYSIHPAIRFLPPLIPQFMPQGVPEPLPAFLGLGWCTPATSHQFIAKPAQRDEQPSTPTSVCFTSLLVTKCTKYPRKWTQCSQDVFVSLSFSDDESFVINTNEVATLFRSHLPWCETFFFPAWKEKKSSTEIQSAKRSDSSRSVKQVSSSFQTLSPLTLSSLSE